MSTIKYSGEVKIKIKNRPPIKTKNNGTQTLFNFLYDTLGGILVPYTDSAKYRKLLPTKIELIKDVPITTDNYGNYSASSVLIEPILLTDRSFTVAQDTINTKSRFLLCSTMLSHTKLSSSYSPDSKGKLLLINGNNKILAYVNLDLAELAAIKDDVNGQAVIEWKLMFSN